MTRDEIREASSTMFKAYMDELCDNRWKDYRTERNWFELVAVDFENHKNIHIIDWVILKNRPHVIFTDDNYPQYDRIHLVFNQFNDPYDKYTHYIEVFKSEGTGEDKTFPIWLYSFPFNKHCISEIEYAYNYYVEQMDHFSRTA